MANVYKEVSGQQGPPRPQQVTPPPPTPRTRSSSTVGTSSAAWAIAPHATTAASLPPQKHLLEVPRAKRGKRWHARMGKAYTPWNPTQAQIWEAHHLLIGESKWKTPKATYLHVAEAKGAASMRYLCGHDSCGHLSASVLDARVITRQVTSRG